MGHNLKATDRLFTPEFVARMQVNDQRQLFEKKLILAIQYKSKYEIGAMHELVIQSGKEYSVGILHTSGVCAAQSQMRL